VHCPPCPFSLISWQQQQNTPIKPGFYNKGKTNIGNLISYHQKGLFISIMLEDANCTCIKPSTIEGKSFYSKMATLSSLL
jgi:hypothetical protein